ncbi:MAG: hypothetical protein PHF64_04310 [Methanoregula sp.]|jgi:hypothetical protein|nr:hypothetical protein [Methanoregula sp.]
MKGRKPTNIRDEAKRCAEQMGYHWQENTDPELKFDGFMFNNLILVAVRIKKIRTTLVDDVTIEKKFPDEVAELRNLPLPKNIIQELWIRTQNERAWRRFYILPGMTAEIGFNTREKYQNTHFDMKEWQNAPVRLTIPRKHHGDADRKEESLSNNLNLGSDCQSDNGQILP